MATEVKSPCENTFVKKYIEENVRCLLLMYPNLPEKYLTNFVERKVSSRITDVSAHVLNTYTHKASHTTLLNILDFIHDKNPIIAGNGSFYYQHNENLAPTSGMLSLWLQERGEKKKLAFKFRDEKNFAEYQRYILWSNNIKICNNSFYGAMAEKRSFGYNASSAAGITAQGRSIATTTLWFIEGFLGGNIYFKTADELMHYIHCIMEEEDHLMKYMIIPEVPPDTDIVNHLMQHYEGTQDKRLVQAMILMILKNIPDFKKIKLFFKNNLYAFIERCPAVKDLIINEMIKPDISYRNPYELPEQFKAPMESLWTLMEEFIYLKPFIMYDKDDRYVTHARHVVTYSDTDSVFIYTGEWLFKVMNWISGIKLSEIKMNAIDKEFALKTINIIMYIISIAIHKTYDTLTGNFGIAPEYRTRIKIKNEYLMDRYIAFDMQKNYVYRNIVNEGHILDPPEFEVKGGNLNAKAKNKDVTKRLKEIVEHVTMDDDVIYPENLLRYIYAFRDEIIASLQHRETRYLPPVKVNTPERYANPYSQYQIRALEAYRIGSADTNITVPGTFYIIDVKDMTKLDLLGGLKEAYPEIYARFEKDFFGKKELAKGGISYIALPMNFEQIPDWIVPYVNIDLIWRKHLNPLISLLPSIGIRQDRIKGKSFYSTILRF
jgi:hypothetical protein